MEKQSRLKNGVTYGLLLGGVLVIVNLLLYLLGMVDLEIGKAAWWSMPLTWVIDVAVLFVGISTYKRHNDNFLSVGDGFKQGVLICLFAGVLYGLYAILFMYVIEPDIVETIKQATYDQMEEQGSINEDSEGITTSVMNIMFNPVTMLILNILSKLIFGMIFGPIIGAIMKNERPYSADEDMGFSE